MNGRNPTPKPHGRCYAGAEACGDTLGSQPALALRLCKARMQARGQQLAEAQAALRQRALVLSAAQQQAAELRKENTSLSKRVRTLEAEVSAGPGGAGWHCNTLDPFPWT